MLHRPQVLLLLYLIYLPVNCQKNSPLLKVHYVQNSYKFMCKFKVTTGFLNVPVFCGFPLFFMIIYTLYRVLSSIHLYKNNNKKIHFLFQPDMLTSRHSKQASVNNNKNSQNEKKIRFQLWNNIGNSGVDSLCVATICKKTFIPECSPL